MIAYQFACDEGKYREISVLGSCYKQLFYLTKKACPDAVCIVQIDAQRVRGLASYVPKSVVLGVSFWDQGDKTPEMVCAGVRRRLSNLKEDGRQVMLTRVGSDKEESQWYDFLRSAFFVAEALDIPLVCADINVQKKSSIMMQGL